MIVRNPAETAQDQRLIRIMAAHFRQAKRLKEVEKENTRLKKLVADQASAKQHDAMLDHLAVGNLEAAYPPEAN